MDEDKLMKTMRAMAWERAKGELLGMLQTYWPKYDHQAREMPNGFSEMDARIKAFIKDVEDNT